MRTTYRSLGVVAIVTLLVLVAQVIIIANSHIQGLPQPPTAFPVDGGPLWLYTTLIWPMTARLYAPIIATFSIVVAAQTRRWGWLAVFIATGLIGSFGSVVFFYFPFLPVFDGRAGVSPNTIHVVNHLATDVMLPALPTLAALVFVTLALRATSPRGGERIGHA